MFGELSGPTIILFGGAALFLLIVVAVVLTVWVVSRSNRARRDELQRAYEAGRSEAGS